MGKYAGRPLAVKKNDERLRMPDNFEWNGWSRANGYLLKPEDFPSKLEYNKARFTRSMKVRNAWGKTEAGKVQLAEYQAAKWEERAAKAKRGSDTTEVLLLEKLTEREDGITTSELVANCINMIAKELAKRGASSVEQLELKDLVLISNTLIGLMKTASATKKDQGWKPQMQVNNITVNNSSKTGGAIGGLEDIIDVEAK